MTHKRTVPALLFPIVLMIHSFLFAQSTFHLQNPNKVYLSTDEYSFTLKRDVLPDSGTSPSFYLARGSHIQPLNATKAKDSSWQIEKASFPSSGQWQLMDDEHKTISELWVVPGWLSLLPPLIAILLALLARQVLVALFAGIFTGALLIYHYNPLMGFLEGLADYVARAAANPDNMAILIFSLALGGMVGVISKSGGTQGIVDRLSKYASDSRRGQLATWAMGIFIFFDDYANTLIVGNTMRPLTDRLKISREKLSYLVDSTAAPVTTVAIISTWIGYQLSLIDLSFKTIHLDANPYLVFLQTIPYNFYPLLALIFAFFIGITGRDLWSMYQAEKRAKESNKVLRDGARPIADVNSSEIMTKEGVPLRWYNAIIPVALVIIITLIGLWVTGVQSTNASARSQGLVHYVSIVFGNADSYRVLIWASFSGSFVAIILAISQRILSLDEALMAWVGGIKSMVMAALILVLAWSLGNICSDLQTADFVINTTSGLLSAKWIPTLTFIIAGIIAFSTGTSWATMAIMTPIVIPLAYHLPMTDPTIDAAHQHSIFVSSIAAVLAGAVFGDHCSPISDTTIMSSMASGADHIDHVRTQLPYASLVAATAIVFGFIPAGFGLSGWWDITLSALVLFLIVRFVGKKV